MTIDATALEAPRRNWNRLNDDPYNRGRDRLDEIQEALEKLGLDLGQDATYELLEDGLTRAAFMTKYKTSVAYRALDQYLYAMTPDKNYIGASHARHAGALEHLLEYPLPALEKVLADPDGTLDVTPLEQKQLDLMRQAAADGTIALEIKIAAAAAVKDIFYTVWSRRKVVLGMKPDDHNISLIQEGLSYANQAMEMIDKAGDFYTPQEVYSESGSNGRDKTSPKVMCSRETLEEAKKFFLIRQVASEFTQAVEWQDKGHFVLDTSGGGFGAMAMPMQNILMKLQEHGCDITNPDIYTEIGTDIDTFKARYRRERAEVLKDDKYKLLKPEVAF